MITYSVGLKSGACGGHVSSERTVTLKKQDYLNLNRHYINKIELNRIKSTWLETIFRYMTSVVLLSVTLLVFYFCIERAISQKCPEDHTPTTTNSSISPQIAIVGLPVDK